MLRSELDFLQGLPFFRSQAHAAKASSQKRARLSFRFRAHKLQQAPSLKQIDALELTTKTEEIAMLHC